MLFLVKRGVYSIVLCAIFLGGCANISSRADKRDSVVVSKSVQGKSCTNLGPIQVAEENGENHRRYMTREHLYRDAVNLLKDKVLELNGNMMVVKNSKITYRNPPKNTLVREVVVTGAAYLCG